MTHITELLNQFGYIVLYISLTLELIAFPLPGETLMVYCGFLIFQGSLNTISCILFSTAGIITGITISYFIGRKLAEPFFYKYGPKFHIGADKLEKVSNWFDKYGNKLLVIAYFIPGVRHVTGYFFGISKIPYKKFALYAYSGALIWASTFILLGKILGAKWYSFHQYISKYLIIGSVILIIILSFVYIVKTFKLQITNFIKKAIEYLIIVFHSLGKVKIVIVGVAIIFLPLSVIFIGLIQDLLANEFGTFDLIINCIIEGVFAENWSTIFDKTEFLTSYVALTVMTVLLIWFITTKGRKKLLEIKFILLTLWGGEVLEEILRYLFHRVGPVIETINRKNIYSFPSEQSLMVIIIYGFATYLIIRYLNNSLLNRLAVASVLLISLLCGLSPLFFKYQYPSDVVAGYVFGGIWLSLNIILLEVFKILPNIKKKES